MAIITTPTTTPNTNAPISYKQTNNAVPTYGENSSSTLALQQSLNKQNNGLAGWTALKEDGKYGPLTQAGVAFKAPTSTQTDPNSTNGTTGTKDTSTSPTDPSKAILDSSNSSMDELSKQRLADAQAVHDQILNIQNGSVPLSAGEQAQVDGLRGEFQTLIDQQGQTNISATGTAQTRGYQTGSAEYDPTFQVKTIGTIITAGANKIAQLNTKMASAVAALTESFRNGKIDAIKSAYNVLDDAKKERQATIQKTIEKIQAQIKEANDAKQKIQDNIDSVAKDAKKNGAPKDVIDKIIASTSTGDALSNAGDYLQNATGDLGDYLQYKRQTEAKGLTPLDYMTFKDKQDAKKNQADISLAYSKAKAEARGKAEGTTPGTTTDENGNVIQTGNMSALDIGRYNLAATRATKTFRDTQTFKAAQNAGFYIAKIKAANEGTGSIQDQEILDSISQFNTGGGRVTEAQVNLILKGKSLNDTVNAWSNKLKNGGVLSDSQRKQALDLAQKTAEEFASNYKKKYDAISSNLEKQHIPKEFWGIPSPEQLRGEVQDDPKNQVDTYIKSNPAQAETVAKLYDLPGWDDAKVLEYINQLTPKP